MNSHVNGLHYDLKLNYTSKSNIDNNMGQTDNKQGRDRQNKQNKKKGKKKGKKGQKKKKKDRQRNLQLQRFVSK